MPRHRRGGRMTTSQTNEYFYFKKFETIDNNYVYSPFLNNIYILDKETLEIIKYYNNKHSEDELKTVIKKDQKKIERLKAIKNIKKELLASAKPNKLLFYLADVEIEKELNNSLEQLTLDITENCNMRCRYCTNSGHFKYNRTYSNIEMGNYIAKKAIDYFIPRANHKRHDPVIGFYGGEPLLSFKLISQIVKYTNNNFKKNIDFQITTNGTLISPDIAKFLIENNIRLGVSLDGPNKINDRYRIFKSQRGTFDTIKKNMLMIRSLDQKYYESRVSFQMVFCPPYDFEEIFNFVDRDEMFCPKTYISATYVKLEDSDIKLDYYNEERKYEDAIFIAKQKNHYFFSNKRSFDNILSSSMFKKAIDSIFLRPKGFCDHFKQYIHVPGICLPGRRKLLVNAKGDFHMCERIEQSYPIGGVKTGFNITRIKSLIDRYCSISEKDCCRCWAFRICEICFVHAFRAGEIDINLKRQNCDIARKKILENLFDYMSIMEKNPNYFSNYNIIDQ